MPTFSGRVLPIKAIIAVFNSFKQSGSFLCFRMGLGSALEADSSFQAPPAGKHTRGVGTVEGVTKKGRDFVLFTFPPLKPCFEMILKCFRNCF